MIVLLQEWEPVKLNHLFGDASSSKEISNGFGNEEYNLNNLQDCDIISQYRGVH